MIESILPAGVMAEEVVAPVREALLFPQEAILVAGAIERRREEFASARHCAHLALARLGVEPQAILSGAHGEPRWPAGVTGSITHCDGYRASAVAREAEWHALGIDAEPHRELPAALVGDIASVEERAMLERLRLCAPTICWDRLLFSAKEAAFKAWFPFGQQHLGFMDAGATIDPRRHTFDVTIGVARSVATGGRLRELAGRWTVQRGLVLTAVAIGGSDR